MATALRIRRLPLPGPLLMTPEARQDDRGHFTEVFNRKTLEAAGISFEIAQDNESFSRRIGTVRGLHLQGGEAVQAKIVRVLSGEIVDVVVDVRPWSATFGRHVVVTLSMADGAHLYVPPGFAHGFCTTRPFTRVAYKVDAPYAPAAELGINWRDPALGIEWPVAAADARISERDAGLPTLAEAREALVAALGLETEDRRCA